MENTDWMNNFYLRPQNPTIAIHYGQHPVEGALRLPSMLLAATDDGINKYNAELKRLMFKPWLLVGNGRRSPQRTTRRPCG